MEQNSDSVAIGRFISDSTYSREDHEIYISTDSGAVVLDFFDAKEKVIHEIKKSDKMEDLHIWQLKYYISVLEEKGVTGVTGLLDYPKLKETKKVELSEADRIELLRIKREIGKIETMPAPPPAIDKPFCKQCSYFDLCYI
jgi:CRISPR-associated exonuclease Cas4